MFTRQADVRKRGHVVPIFTRQSDVRKLGHVVPMVRGSQTSKSDSASNLIQTTEFLHRYRYISGIRIEKRKLKTDRTDCGELWFVGASSNIQHIPPFNASKNERLNPWNRILKLVEFSSPGYGI